MQEETWRDIPDYPGYQASALGRIRSVGISVFNKPSRRCHEGFWRKMPPKLLTPRPSANGYLRVAFGKANRDVYVHYCVATAFCGPRPEAHQVRHLNGDKHDNRASNIEWGSARENLYDIGRHGRRLLKADDVISIRSEYDPLLRNGGVLARKYGVSNSVISEVVRGRVYAWVEPN